MNKELRKKIETELAVLINATLSKRDEKAAAEVSKHIKKGVKEIARKFIKHLPKETAGKSKEAKKSKSLQKSKQLVSTDTGKANTSGPKKARKVSVKKKGGKTTDKKK